MQKLTILCLILLPVLTAAQPADSNNYGVSMSFAPNSLSIGIISGVAVSHTRITNSKLGDSESPLVGFSGGIHIQQFLTKRIAVVLNVLYEQKGYNLKIPIPEMAGEKGNNLFQFKFNYVTLPLLASYQTTGKIKLKFGAGFYTGFLINAHTYEPMHDIVNPFGENPEWEFEGYMKRNQNEYIKRFDVGLLAQTGFATKVTKTLFVGLDFNYCYGLRSITEPSSFGDVEYINHSGTVLININHTF